MSPNIKLNNKYTRNRPITMFMIMTPIKIRNQYSRGRLNITLQDDKHITKGKAMNDSVLFHNHPILLTTPHLIHLIPTTGNHHLLCRHMSRTRRRHRRCHPPTELVLLQCLQWICMMLMIMSKQWYMLHLSISHHVNRRLLECTNNHGAKLRHRTSMRLCRVVRRPGMNATLRINNRMFRGLPGHHIPLLILQSGICPSSRLKIHMTRRLFLKP